MNNLYHHTLTEHAIQSSTPSWIFWVLIIVAVLIAATGRLWAPTVVKWFRDTPMPRP